MSYLEEVRWFLTGVFEDGDILDIIIICHQNLIPYFCAKFQPSSMIRSVLRTPDPLSHTLRILNVPDWSFEGWVHPWHHISLWCAILYLFAKFQLSSMISSMSRTPSPQSHILRMVKVPDWSLGGWGHLWHHRSSWLTKMRLSWKFREDLLGDSVKPEIPWYPLGRFTLCPFSHGKTACHWMLPP